MVKIHLAIFLLPACPLSGLSQIPCHLSLLLCLGWKILAARITCLHSSGKMSEISRNWLTPWPSSSEDSSAATTPECWPWAHRGPLAVASGPGSPLGWPCICAFFLKESICIFLSTPNTENFNFYYYYCSCYYYCYYCYYFDNSDLSYWDNMRVFFFS